MKVNLTIIKIATVIALSVTASCTATSSAKLALKGMKAEKYFIPPVQIELAKAVEKGDAKAIDVAIAKGANVNYVGNEEMTPLAWAFSKQNITSFRKLLEKGADSNFMTKKKAWNNVGTSVMQLAAMTADSEYLRLALKHGGNPNGLDELPGQRVLNTAIRNHRKENVKILVKAGADINHQDGAGFTPIMHAHSQTQYDMVYLLMHLGADLSKRHHINPTPDNKIIHGGKTLPEMIKRDLGVGGRLLKKEKEQREWYNKVLIELRRRGLL